ncbi:Saccharopine dehydrogenase, NADP binding domain [Dillenia turbinata]|uniref:Saccharopine dehydrogenase, NADP binding domain n=1 Tax=Dillenia turbinata TaxID=194707 RepID=A0AAN8VDV2_9MAGN
MEENQSQYDLIILGASGFTGKYVVREVLKFLNTPNSPLKTLALAGRNTNKLSQILQWATHPSTPPQIPVITADVTDPSTLKSLCCSTKLILNCVGPFRLYGEPVVAACVDSGCDYLDICGKPEFTERMEVDYHDKAVEKGRLVVSVCGFDSVPAEFGWMFNSRQWVEPSVPNKELRKSRPRRPRSLAILTENPRGLPGVNESPEHIKRESFWSTMKPAHFGVKIASKSLLGLFRFIMVGMLIGLLGMNSFGRRLLLKFPFVFSLGWFKKKGPSEDEVRSACFKMYFVGQGYNDSSLASHGKKKPNKEIITRVIRPEIGYLTTPIILLQCALTVLSQREDLPRGVYTPGIVFGPTDLQQRLQENGISFDVISGFSFCLSTLVNFTEYREATVTKIVYRDRVVLVVHDMVLFLICGKDVRKFDLPTSCN